MFKNHYYSSWVPKSTSIPTFLIKEWQFCSHILLNTHTNACRRICMYAHVYVYIHICRRVHAYMYTYVHVAYAHNVSCGLHVWCVYMWDLVHIVFSVSSETRDAGNSLTIFIILPRMGPRRETGSSTQRRPFSLTPNSSFYTATEEGKDATYHHSYFFSI